MTLYSYDTEFLEDGKTIELISIGIVADDGREYYAVNSDAPWKRIAKHQWLVENVVPSLPELFGDSRMYYGRKGPLGIVDFQHRDFKPKTQIADEVRAFLLAGTKPELWAYFAAYDHVALCQLWGTMVDLPAGIPMWTHDLKQEIDRLVAAPPEQADGHHNALDDARWVDRTWQWLAANAT